MPLECRIDLERRVVFAVATGTLTLEDFLVKHREVWSRSDVAGFDAIYDLGGIEDLVLSSGERLRELADLASTLDPPGAAARLAIVAPRDFAFGIARMYEAYRTMNQRGSKAVSVFRSMQAALDWLGLEGPGDPAGGSPSGPRASS
jgi:hypothetical protein